MLNKEEAEKLKNEIDKYNSDDTLKQIIDQFTEQKKSESGRCLNSLTDYIEERIKYFEQSNKMESVSGSQYNDGAIAAYMDILKNIITKEPNESFEIPVMKVFRNANGELDFAITGGDVEDWHLAIATNAAAIKECKWVTVGDNFARFWQHGRPDYNSGYWENHGGSIFQQFVYPSLIPADCSMAIVRIEHA